MLEGIKIFNDKIARKLPLVILIDWSLDIARYLEFTRPEKTRDYCFDMKNEKTPRMEELESVSIQEKTAQMTKMVINLTKRKGITDDPDLQRKPTSWKCNIDPFIVPSPSNHGKQEELRKNRSGRSEHVNVQQRCDLLDKKLKEIEGVTIS